MFHLSNAVNNCSEEVKKELGTLKYIQPVFFNKRIGYQCGAFTLSSKIHIHDLLWVEEACKHVKRLSQPIFHELTFKCSKAQQTEMLNILDNMNINYRTLFPDVEGSVKGAVAKGN